MTQSLTERYRDRLAGVLSCYDRIVITGTLPRACYAGGMTSFLYSRGSHGRDCKSNSCKPRRNLVISTRRSARLDRNQLNALRVRVRNMGANSSYAAFNFQVNFPSGAPPVPRARLTTQFDWAGF